MSRLFSGRRASVGPSNTFKRNQSTTGPAVSQTQPQPATNTSTTTNPTINTNTTSNSTAHKPSPPQPIHLRQAAPLFNPVAANNLSETEIKGLLGRVESKLPCNSGQSLGALASDPVLGKAVDGLVDFAVQSGDFVIVGLAKILEKLKKSRTLPDGTVPDQVLDSQLFLLKVMNRAMSRRWPSENQQQQPPNATTASTMSGSSSTPSFSHALPPSLDIQAVLYVIYILWTCIPGHIIANIGRYRWTKHIVEREPGLGTVSGIGRYKSAAPPAMSPLLPILEPMSTSATLYAHSYTQDEALHGLYFASVSVLIGKYISRLFYHLSASNWATIHLLFKTRLQFITEGVVTIDINGSGTPRTTTTPPTTNQSSNTTGIRQIPPSKSTTASKPGSSAGVTSSNSNSFPSNSSNSNNNNNATGKYIIPSLPSTNNNMSSFTVGDDHPSLPPPPSKPERSGAISVGVNLLKKGREKEKGKEKEREREREKERERERERLAVTAVNYSTPGGDMINGPASPRSFTTSSGQTNIGSGGVGSNSTITGFSSVTSFLPSHSNLSVQNIARLASPVGDSGGGIGHGIVDMIFKMVSVSMIDSGRMWDIFGDILKFFPNLPMEAQDQSGILIRDLIMSFAENCSSEFWSVWNVTSPSGGDANGNGNGIGYQDKSDGLSAASSPTVVGSGSEGWLLAERLYDLIWDSTTRRLPTFYATLATLLCLLPERFEGNMDVLQNLSKAATAGKKNAFLKHLAQIIRSRPANTATTNTVKNSPVPSSNSNSNSNSNSTSGGGGGGGLGTLFGLSSSNSNSQQQQRQQQQQQQQQQSDNSTSATSPSTPTSVTIPDLPVHPHELAAQAVLDILRLGYIVPPVSWVASMMGSEGATGGGGGGGGGGGDVNGEECLLRSVSGVFGGLLKDFLLNNPQTRTPFYLSPDPIDPDFYVYCVSALFRLWPEIVLRDIIMICLEPEKANSVKYVVVKAIILLLVEQPKYPYQPDMEFVWPIIVSRIRGLFISCISATPEVIDGTVRIVSPTPICKTLAKSRAYAQALGISAPSGGSNPENATSPSNSTPQSVPSNPPISITSSISASTSGSGIPLPGVIREELRLFVAILSAMPIELKCAFYAAAPDDHVYMMRRAAGCLEPHRDKRDTAVAVMCLRSVIGSCIDAGAAVKEGLDFVTYSVPGACVNAGVIMTTCAEDLDLIRICLTCLHAIIQGAASFSSDERENVWRTTPLLRTVMDFAEFALYITLPTHQQDISVISQLSLRLISLYEHNPRIGKAPHLTESQWAQRTAFLESFDNPRDPPSLTMGRVAFHKRIRKIMQQVPFLSPIHIIAFKELWFRFSKLTAKVEELQFKKIAGSGFGSNHKDIEDLHEWQHTMYLLATCIHPDMEDNVPPFPALFLPMLPPRLASNAKLSDMSVKFVAECVKLLASDHIQIREYTKEALGSELNFMLFPVLFDQFDKEITRRLGTGSGFEHALAQNPSTLVFVEQCLVILKMNFERLNGTVTVFDNNAPANLLQIGRYIARLSQSSSSSFNNQAPSVNSSGSSISLGPGDSMYLRLRMKFCAAAGYLLSKRQFFAIREETSFRSQLCDILINWLDEHVDGTGPSPLGEFKQSNETFLSVMKLFTMSLENLSLVVNDNVVLLLPVASNGNSDPNVNAPDPEQIVAQKARHYITSLTRALRVQEAPAGSVINLSLDSLSSQDDAPLIHELVVTGISHLLQNNSKATKLHCLTGCYDSNVLLRVVFMKAFTRVLALGTKLDLTQNRNGLDADGPGDGAAKGDEICKLLRNSDLVTFAVVEACPQQEVETIVPVLLKLYDTPEKLLTFLKATINREITKTESPTSLLRHNTLCARLITSFARLHGYSYLRHSIAYLVELMLDYPDDTSFEIEPAKLSPEESLEANIAVVLQVVSRFVEYLVHNVETLPKPIRQVCHHIAETVSTTWPESKYPALGAFVFLRFLCPSIVAPENVNITGYEYNFHIRRGLVTIAKVLQSISNQIPYSRESYHEPINAFLIEHRPTVLQFLRLIQESDTEARIEETVNLYPGASEADVLILHKFVQTHANQIGQELLDFKETNGTSSPSSGQPLQAKGSGAPVGMTMTAKQAWDALCALLVDTKARLEVPRLSTQDEHRHTAYQNFMRRNQRRSTDAVSDAFRIDSVVNNTMIYVFTWTKVDMDVVDLELLVYHIFKKLVESSAKKLDIDIVFDFTAFTPRSQLPTAWIKLLIELLPLNIRERWRTIYMLNVNTEALNFIRKVASLFHGLSLAQKIVTVPTLADLRSWLGNIPSLMENSLPALLESSEEDVWQNVHYQVEQQPWTSANVHIGTNYIRVVSVTPEKLHSEYVVYLVEVIHLRDIEDVFRGANQQRITLRQYHRRPIMMFELPQRNQLLKAIQKAKRTYVANNRTPLLPSAQTSDTCATLLAIGLLHSADKTEFVRGAAYKLLDANCAYLGYTFDAVIPWRSSFFPSNPSAFIVPLSSRISAFSHNMTLDFILEWAGGMANATTLQKSISLQYLAPWITNLDIFSDPTNPLYDAARLRKCLRIFVDVTMQDQEVYATFQRTIWVELAKLGPQVTDILLAELTEVAFNDGMDSLRCELVADTLVAFSSMHIRTRIMSELRDTLSAAFDKPTVKIVEALEWKAITVLTRLSLASGHGMDVYTTNQLRASETVHVITMLAGVGSLTMRISIHGMALNLLQTLYTARIEDETAGMQLRGIIDDLNSAEYLKMFGLCHPYPSGDTILFSSDSKTSLNDLEKIARLLSKALVIGATSVGLKNIWKARWMSLVSVTAFQTSPYAQFRAFIVLGILAEIDAKDAFLYKWLDLLRKNIMAENMDSCLAILRCLTNVIHTVGSHSKIPASLFWLGVAMLHTAIVPIRAEALQLMKACVETLDKQNVFRDFEAEPDKNPVESVLMNAREDLREGAGTLEALGEISFEKSFGWALVALFWKNVRTRNDSNVTKEVVMAMLRIAIRCSPGAANEERKSLDSLTMPLLMGLSHCYDRRSFERFLEQECYIVDPFRSMANGSADFSDDDDYHLNTDLLGIHNSQDGMLAFTFCLVIENNNLNGLACTEHLHFLWAELAKSFPDECTWAVWHFKETAPPEWMQKKYETAFSSGMSDAHIKAVASCFDLMISRVANITPEGTPSASATSLPQSLTEADSPSANFRTRMTALGLHGLWTPLLRYANIEPPVPADRARKVRSAVSDLIQLIQP